MYFFENVIDKPNDKEQIQCDSYGNTHAILQLFVHFKGIRKICVVQF